MNEFNVSPAIKTEAARPAPLDTEMVDLACATNRLHESIDTLIGRLSCVTGEGDPTAELSDARGPSGDSNLTRATYEQVMKVWDAAHRIEAVTGRLEL